MFGSDANGSTKIDPNSGEGEPANSFKRPKIDKSSQFKADPSLQQMNYSGNDDDDKPSEYLREDDASRLTNIDKFFDTPVWSLVLGKLKDKADIENCSNASPFFGDLLQRKREQEVVLPAAFSILTRLYFDINNKDESYKETNLESIPWRKPTDTKKPKRLTGIWKCRMVCKTWNLAIEEVHRKEDFHYWMVDFDIDAIGLPTECFRNDETQIVKFLDHFEETHYKKVLEGFAPSKCPFLGNAVAVYCYMDYVRNPQIFFNSLMEMFAKYGDRVYYFKFWLCCGMDEIYDHVEIYCKLKHMVELMPNMKLLRINCFVFLTPSQEELQDLEEEILRNPWPVGANLEMIMAGRIPGVFCNHIVNRNRHISQLKIDCIDFNGKCDLFVNELPNLRKLSLAGMKWSEIFEAFERYPFILNLEMFNFQGLGDVPFVPWSRVFNAIQSKLNPDMCKDFNMKMSAPKSDAEKLSVLQESLLCRLQLTNIQRCQIRSSAPFSLDFLLLSKNTLNEIEVILSCKLAQEATAANYEDLREKQVIKFLGIEKKMEQSNIAIQLPHLRKLDVQTDDDRLKRSYNIQPNGIV